MKFENSWRSPAADSVEDALSSPAEPVPEESCSLSVSRKGPREGSVEEAWRYENINCRPFLRRSRGGGGLNTGIESDGVVMLGGLVGPCVRAFSKMMESDLVNSTDVRNLSSEGILLRLEKSSAQT